MDISAHDELLRLLDNGKVIATFPVTVGSDQLPAPMGSWKVENVTALPEFRWDEKMLNEGTRSSDALNLPPGPRTRSSLPSTPLRSEQHSSTSSSTSRTPARP